MVIPRVSTSPDRIDELVQRSELDVDRMTELLEANRLFVIDALGDGSRTRTCSIPVWRMLGSSI